MRVVLVLLAAVLAAGCYSTHSAAGAVGDAGTQVGPIEGGTRRERCRVRWVCSCDDAGACARWDGSRCQPDDLRDPDRDPCRDRP